MIEEKRDDLGEYHARQRAVAAENQVGSERASAASRRKALGELEKVLRRALAHLDDAEPDEARAEVVAALETLKRIRP